MPGPHGAYDGLRLKTPYFPWSSPPPSSFSFFRSTIVAKPPSLPFPFRFPPLYACAGTTE